MPGMSVAPGRVEMSVVTEPIFHDPAKISIASRRDHAETVQFPSQSRQPHDENATLCSTDPPDRVQISAPLEEPDPLGHVCPFPVDPQQD